MLRLELPPYLTALVDGLAYTETSPQGTQIGHGPVLVEECMIIAAARILVAGHLTAAVDVPT
jgi:hypothetical protein